MAGKYFRYSDVLGYGWSVMKANAWFFVGVSIVFMTVSYLPSIADMVVVHSSLPGSVSVALRTSLFVVGWIISIIVAIGLVKIALSFCDEGRPAMGTLFEAGDCFWRYLGTAILYSLIVFAGFILFIIPGIIWSVKYCLCFYFVIDKGLGPVEALKASGRTTMGVKWELLGFGVICGLINLLGLLCLVVGIFATYPTVLVANALVYRQLSAQSPELAEFGIGTGGKTFDSRFPAGPSRFSHRGHREINNQ